MQHQGRLDRQDPDTRPRRCQQALRMTGQPWTSAQSRAALARLPATSVADKTARLAGRALLAGAACASSATCCSPAPTRRCADDATPATVAVTTGTSPGGRSWARPRSRSSRSPRSCSPGARPRRPTRSAAASRAADARPAPAASRSRVAAMPRLGAQRHVRGGGGAGGRGPQRADPRVDLPGRRQRRAQHARPDRRLRATASCARGSASTRRRRCRSRATRSSAGTPR